MSYFYIKRWDFYAVNSKREGDDDHKNVTVFPVTCFCFSYQVKTCIWIPFCPNAVSYDIIFPLLINHYIVCLCCFPLIGNIADIDLVLSIYGRTEEYVHGVPKSGHIKLMIEYFDNFLKYGSRRMVLSVKNVWTFDYEKLL